MYSYPCKFIMRATEIKRLDKILLFDITFIRGLFPSESSESLYIRLSDWENRGLLVRLKRGVYITKENFLKFESNPEFLEIVACFLVYPSYLTAEYELRKYSVNAEATYGITLVSSKSKTSICNKLGTFTYREISPKLFVGYHESAFMGYKILKATKAKALFDYLYFKKGIIPHENADLNLVEELRLNLDIYSKDDLLELKSYGELSSQLMRKIIQNIIQNAPNH